MKSQRHNLQPDEPSKPQLYYDGLTYRKGEYFETPEDMEEGESWADYHGERTLAFIGLWAMAGFVAIGIIGYAIWRCHGGVN